MDAILSSSVVASDALPARPRKIDIVLDHARRSRRAMHGFRVYKTAWLRPWIAFVFSPLLNRVLPPKHISYGAFHVRRGECDLQTFASVFEDYQLDLVRHALRDVELVVDLGANVGAFSSLVTKLAREEHRGIQIRAVEPQHETVSVLREQPFADWLEIFEAAVGPIEGEARIVRGENSVSHHVDLAGESGGASVPVLTLASLCDRPALVKMDIEGGEHEILCRDLPANVRHLFLEWHPNVVRPRLLPRDLVAGNWQLLSRDPYGASMWYLSRDDQPPAPQ